MTLFFLYALESVQNEIDSLGNLAKRLNMFILWTSAVFLRQHKSFYL